MNKISDNISWNEAVNSSTAERLELDNIPDKEQVKAMIKVAEKVFQPLREWCDHPIKVNSFYRSPEVCKAIGSKITSQHTKGEAIDIDTLGSTPNGELFYYIKNNLDFDQLIWEKGDNDNPDWIHVSYVSKKENRGVVLQAWKPEGKSYTLYKYFDLDAETS